MNVPVILRRRRFQYGGGVVPVPANAIRDRANDPILDRAGAYILTRS